MEVPRIQMLDMLHMCVKVFDYLQVLHFKHFLFETDCVPQCLPCQTHLKLGLRQQFFQSMSYNSSVMLYFLYAKILFYDYTSFLDATFKLSR